MVQNIFSFVQRIFLTARRGRLGGGGRGSIQEKIS